MHPIGFPCRRQSYLPGTVPDLWVLIPTLLQPHLFLLALLPERCLPELFCCLLYTLQDLLHAQGHLCLLFPLSSVCCKVWRKRAPLGWGEENTSELGRQTCQVCLGLARSVGERRAFEGENGPAPPSVWVAVAGGVVPGRCLLWGPGPSRCFPTSREQAPLSSAEHAQGSGSPLCLLQAAVLQGCTGLLGSLQLHGTECVKE